MICLGFIAFQDFKERKVFWFLFPLAMVLFGLLHYLQSIAPEIFFYYALINFLLITCIIATLFIHTRFILKKAFLNHSLGLGDILFFYAFGLGFSSVTFIVLLVGAVVFSLLAFLLFKKRLKLDTVPLAGLMGFFLVFVILFSLVSKSPSLYAY
jgi:hypothetical protein